MVEILVSVFLALVVAGYVTLTALALWRGDGWVGDEDRAGTRWELDRMTRNDGGV